MKILFVYPRFSRHAEHHPELRSFVPMNEYLGSPSLGIAAVAAATPKHITVEHRDDRLEPADGPTDADIVALSFFTPAAMRGMELADKFKAMGKTVIAGGIFPTMMPDEVQPHVDSVVVGEGEGVWPQVLDDYRRGQLKPRYVAEPMDVDQVPVARTELYFAAERKGVFEPDDYPLQISRGCSLKCDACALPTSMGKYLRALPLDHILAQLDKFAAAGRRACLTEDTSWLPGPGKRRLIELVDALASRGREANISYIGISMPMINATSVAFFEKVHAIGVRMFYLVGGFDPITTRAFTGKDPRALQKAMDAIKKSYDVGIEPYTSFLIGNDGDDEGTVDRMLAFAAASGIRKAEFAVATPYPGTPAWDRVVSQGRLLHRDWSRYNDANVVFRPAQMSVEALERAYIDLWKGFYAARGAMTDLRESERTIQF